MAKSKESYQFADILDDESARIAREDPKQLIEKLFFIIDKSGKKVPFIFNEAQNEYYQNRTYCLSV